MSSQTFQTAHLNVVSSLWLEYPLELRTWRLAKFCVDFPGFRDRYDDFVFLFKLPGDVSDEDDVVSCWGSNSNEKNDIISSFDNF